MRRPSFLKNYTVMSAGWTHEDETWPPMPPSGLLVPTGTCTTAVDWRARASLQHGCSQLVLHHARSATCAKGLAGSLMLTLGKTGNRPPNIWGSPAEWLQKSPSTVHREGFSVSKHPATTKSITKSLPGCWWFRSRPVPCRQRASLADPDRQLQSARVPAWSSKSTRGGRREGQPTGAWHLGSRLRSGGGPCPGLHHPLLPTGALPACSCPTSHDPRSASPGSRLRGAGSGSPLARAGSAHLSALGGFIRPRLCSPLISP